MRVVRTGFGWLVDQAIEHWPAIVAVLSGFAMTYLATISAWLQPYGPVAWGSIGIGTVVLLSGAFFLFGLARERIAFAKYAEMKSVAPRVNVLSPTHENEKIELSSLYHPFYRAIENVRFENCDLIGPANLMTFGGTFSEVGFTSCEIIIIRGDRPIWGGIALKNCSFIRCNIYRATFLMNIASYRALPEKMRQNVPVISDGRVGDL